MDMEVSSINDGLILKDRDAPEKPRFSARFSTLVAVFTLVLLTLFATLSEYPAGSSPDSTIEYIFYLHVTIMMIVGFGYLMTAMRFYGLTALGFTLMITVLSILWCSLTGRFFSSLAGNPQNGYEEGEKVQVGINALLQGNFGAAAVLISYGAVLGKLTPTQTLLLVVLEIPIYSFNKEIIAMGLIETLDMGGTIFIHLFGCYFGLAATWMLGPPPNPTSSDAETSKVSELFSFVGTAFLWIFWPSFNGATAGVGQSQQLYTTVNTVFALCGSTVTTFVASGLFNKGRFSPADLQNATLAGGVAIGASSNLILSPAVALAVGIIAGAISVWGFNFLSATLERSLNLHDTAGVHNLHGLPAIFGAIVVTIATSVSAATPMIEDTTGAHPLTYPQGSSQPWAQLGGAVATLFVALIGGLLTGLIIRRVNDPAPARNRVDFRDKVWWITTPHEV